MGAAVRPDSKGVSAISAEIRDDVAMYVPLPEKPLFEGVDGTGEAAVAGDLWPGRMIRATE